MKLWCFNVGPASATWAQHWNIIVSTCRVCWDNTLKVSCPRTACQQTDCPTMLVQCWPDVTDDEPIFDDSQYLFKATCWDTGPRFIKLKRYELVRIAHLHMRIVEFQRVGQSARILPIHVKEGDIRGKLTRFYFLVSGRPRSRELRDLVSFQLDKTGPWGLTLSNS